MFEVYLPSCRFIQFVNGDTIIAAQDGDSQIYLCSVDAQRKVWQNKDANARAPDKMILVSELESYSKYNVGLMA